MIYISRLANWRIDFQSSGTIKSFLSFSFSVPFYSFNFPIMYFSIAFAVAVVLGASGANGHMKMSSPSPFGPNSLSNGPLQNGGLDFPCKLRPGVWDKPEHANNFPVGSTQQLELIGSAAHGGGSCQISLTTDQQPSKDSKWMVIKSFEGGCTADVQGNLPTNSANAPDPYKFNFTIPEDMPNGDYTLAWTWLNRVGDREFYMNCAPITVTGGKDGGPQPTDKYPPMFVANINDCIVPEGKAVRFPNPGPNVQVGSQNVQAQGQPACEGNPTFGGDGIKSGGGGSSDGGGGDGATSIVAEAAAEPTSSSSAAIASSTSAGATPMPSAGGGSGQPKQGPCPNEGDYYCLGTSYQRCASGTWSPVQQLASGMSCPVGERKDLDMHAVNPSLNPRNLESMRGHFRRHVAHVATHHE